MCEYCDNYKKGAKPYRKDYSYDGSSHIIVKLDTHKDENDLEYPSIFTEKEYDYEGCSCTNTPINFCPWCGAFLIEADGHQAPHTYNRPLQIGHFKVTLDNDVNVAIPNPLNNYDLFTKAIKDIASGKYNK